MVRKVSHEPPFEEALVPMDPHGEYVQICKDRIRVGILRKYAFRYTRVPNADPPRLVLESPFTRIVLQKWSANAGDVRKSWVDVPLKFYSHEKLQALEREYRRRCMEAARRRTGDDVKCERTKRVVKILSVKMCGENVVRAKGQ